jgi:acetylornithine/N-succinyldiaminopimelate aminotransferase
MMQKIIFLFIFSIDCLGASRLGKELTSKLSPVISPWLGRTTLSSFKIVGGEHVYLYDDRGRQFFDVSAGLAVSNLGHSNHKIIEAIQKTLAFPYVAPFLDIPGRQELTQRLLNKAGMPEGGGFWCNTGSEANNLLRRSAIVYHNFRGNPKKTKIATMQESFHGAIGDVRSMTRDGRTNLFRSSTESSDFIALPAPRKGQEESTLAEIKQIVMSNHDSIAAILLPGHGGSGEAAGRHWPEMAELYREISKLCQDYDILMFWDCVMSGGGRVGGDASGRGYFASDNYKDVKVDGRSMAKGLTAGYGSGGLMMVNQPVAEAIDAMGCDFGSTYSGQCIPVASAVLDTIEADDHAILRNASEMGDLWASELAPQLVDRFPEIILEANGTGLLQALLIDKSVDLAKLKEALIEENLLVFTMRRKLDNNIVMLITPPLVIEQKEMSDIFYAIYKALLTL